MWKLLIIIIALPLFAFGCNKSTSYDSSVSGSYYNSYEDEDYFEPKNPYSEGTGHSAGFDWAEETGGNCTAPSTSFNEGCEEYYNQLENGEY